jgi:hypothetical protein
MPDRAVETIWDLRFGGNFRLRLLYVCVKEQGGLEDLSRRTVEQEKHWIPA